MKVVAICGAVLGLLFTVMLATVLRLTWRASREKTAREQRNDARAVTNLQARADQAATDACQTDEQLQGALGNGTF